MIQNLPPEEASNIRILVIDDSRSIVDVLTNILSKQGYQVQSCYTGKACWRRLVRSAEGEGPLPDLLLLDLMLPDIKGMTILRRIRSDRRLSRIPVVILTVRDEPEIRLQALEAGANDYLTKPFETVELLARVRTLLAWKLTERFQQQRMEHLIEAGRILLSTLNLDNVLQQVMEIAIKGLNAEGASVWLYDPDKGLVCRAVSGKSADRLLRVTIEPGQGIAGWAFQRQKSTLVPDVQSDIRFSSEVSKQIGFETEELVAVPLLVRGHSIGVLEAVNKKEGAFSEADLSWTEVLAPLAAAGIANARLFKSLQQHTEELKDRNKELDAFAHTVAHDLQNPLTLIIGFTEALQQDHENIPEDELKRHFRTIAQTSRKMNNIIDELMLLAQVRQMKAKTNVLDMEKIVAAALERLAYIIENYDATIVQPNTWPVALGYGPWVEEVWVNYIHNAIKYGGRPPHIVLGGTAQSNGTTRFWVRDNGSGLKPEEQAKLFTPFTQLEQVRVKGHGLGLSIVRRIVEKLGGEVDVESEVGEGSEFSFTLPGAKD